MNSLYDLLLKRIPISVAGVAYVLRGYFSGSEYLEKILICGPPGFRRAVTEALLLLQHYRPSAWKTLTAHVEAVFPGPNTFLRLDPDTAFFLISEKDAANVVHLAGCLAHQVRSCQLYRDHQARNPGRKVPKDVWAGPAAAELCQREYDECVAQLNAIHPDSGTSPHGGSTKPCERT